MATTKTPKRPSFMTPKGVTKYPSLTKPDFGTEEFPKPDGEFKTSLIMSAEAAQPFIDKLQPLWEEAIAKGQKLFDALPIASRKKLKALTEQPFYEEEYAGEQGEEQPTGNVIFKCKTKFRIKDKKTGDVRENRIGLFDAKGKPLGKGIAIYGGSVGIANVTPSDYFVSGQGMAGITLRLNAFQVIELVGPGARSASSYGFGAQEGYEAGDDDGFGDESSEGGEDQGGDAGPQDF